MFGNETQGRVTLRGGVRHAVAMTGDDPLALYQVVHALMQASEFQAALDVLAAAPVALPAVHHRQRAYALHNLTRWDEAHVAIQQALGMADEDQRSAIFVDWAVMHMREQRFTEGFRLYHQALAMGGDYPDARASALYNLGWSYLRRLHLHDALDTLREGLAFTLATRDADARWRVSFFRCGLSLVARARGDGQLALDRAQQAVRLAPPDRSRALALRTLATTQRLQGQLDAAAHTQQDALALAHGSFALDTERAHLALVELARSAGPARHAQVQLLNDLAPRLAPYDAWRVRLHLAQDALTSGRRDEALGVLRAALAADEPYVLHDEAPALTPLYAFGRRRGLSLPAPVPTRPPTVHLSVRSQPGLRVCGESPVLDRALPLGVLLYLHQMGAATPAAIAAALLDHPSGTAGLSAVRRAVREVAGATGSDALVVRTAGGLALNPAWTVTTDLGDSDRPVLPELYGAWTGQL